eukprot:s2860_g4.t1
MLQGRMTPDAKQLLQLILTLHLLLVQLFKPIPAQRKDLPKKGGQGECLSLRTVKVNRPDSEEEHGLPRSFTDSGFCLEGVRDCDDFAPFRGGRSLLRVAPKP